MKHSFRTRNRWHKQMYDFAHAKFGLDSRLMHKRAIIEADFILQKTQMAAGKSILDIPCGVGRHASVFGKRGLHVLGLDISNDCLQLAKKNNRFKTVNFKLGNMLNLGAYKNRFDLVCNLFSSFGYFSTDTENFHSLKAMINCLKPGGHFVMQTLNRDFLLSVFEPNRCGEDKTTHWFESTTYNEKTHYTESDRMIIDKKSMQAKKYYFRIRQYSVSEIVKLMKKAGLTNIRVYNGPDGKKVDRLKSSHPIYIGQKKG